MRLGEEYVELYRSLVLLDFYFRFQNQSKQRDEDIQNHRYFCRLQ